MFKSQQYRARAGEYGAEGSAVPDESRFLSRIAGESPHKDSCDKPWQVARRDSEFIASALSRWDNEGGRVRDERLM
jgi:hypothetical protein